MSSRAKLFSLECEMFKRLDASHKWRNNNLKAYRNQRRVEHPYLLIVQDPSMLHPENKKSFQSMASI